MSAACSLGRVPVPIPELVHLHSIPLNIVLPTSLLADSILIHSSLTGRTPSQECLKEELTQEMSGSTLCGSKTTGVATRGSPSRLFRRKH